MPCKWGLQWWQFICIPWVGTTQHRINQAHFPQDQSISIWNFIWKLLYLLMDLTPSPSTVNDNSVVAAKTAITRDIYHEFFYSLSNFIFLLIIELFRSANTQTETTHVTPAPRHNHRITHTRKKRHTNARYVCRSATAPIEGKDDLSGH